MTLARHPSETDERMMIRLLAFALNAHEHLLFTKGLSTDDEPDVWLKNHRDEIELWIDLGQPDEKRLRKACGRAEQVVIYNYGGNPSDHWWQAVASKVNRFTNLQVINLAADETKRLAALAERNMQLTFTIQEGHVLISNGENAVELTLQVRK